jgi:hypothetical protein
MRTMTRRIHQAVCKYSIISNNAVYQKLLPPEKENVEKIEMSFYCRRSNWIVYDYMYMPTHHIITNTHSKTVAKKNVDL